jgi:hypothetical protein
MLDQQQKQSLPFKEGHILQDFEGICWHRNLNEIYLLTFYDISTVNVIKSPLGTGLYAECAGSMMGRETFQLC